MRERRIPGLRGFYRLQKSRQHVHGFFRQVGFLDPQLGVYGVPAGAQLGAQPHADLALRPHVKRHDEDVVPLVEPQLRADAQLVCWAEKVKPLAYPKL